MSNVNLIIFRYNLVARMTKTLLSKTGEGFFATPDSMITMLEVTKRLNNVAKQLTTVASVRSSADDQEDAENMLVYYLGIVNLAFGRNSSGTWKQVQHRLLHHLLWFT